MLSRFLVLLTLYVTVMFVGNLHFGQDDTRLTGAHIRTLVSALQVWIASALLSVYSMFMFFIGVVKSERTSFVLVSRAPPSSDRVEFALEDVEEPAAGVQPPEQGREDQANFDCQSEHLSVVSNPLPLNIVFESSVNLDLYVLYVNFVGLMLWCTFVSFNFATYDSSFVLMSGVVLGWIFNTLSKECHCHESKSPPVKGEKVRVLCCTSLSCLVMALGAVSWEVPADIEFGDAVNLYGPAFCAGFFWTAVGHEVAFAGVQNLHVTRGILYDSRRSLPTFLLVVTVSALCSSPETRATVLGYVSGLSRAAVVHMLLVEPVLIFLSLYVMIIALEKQRGMDLAIVLVLVEGVYIAYRRETNDALVITTIAASVLLFSVHASHLLRAP
jgi:hypothetical protein